MTMLKYSIEEDYGLYGKYYWQRMKLQEREPSREYFSYNHPRILNSKLFSSNFKIHIAYRMSHSLSLMSLQKS